jgi:hypothetical protein
MRSRPSAWPVAAPAILPCLLATYARACRRGLAARLATTVQHCLLAGDGGVAAGGGGMWVTGSNREEGG